MKHWILTCLLFFPLVTVAQQPVTWRFDSLTHIGGNPTELVGSPKVVDTPLGKAIHFEGHTDADGHSSTGDAIYLETLPLAGASEYTFEVIFRPSSAGNPEQRFFHLQEAGTQSRRMFEIRIHPTDQGPRWCLDTVAFTYPPSERPRSGVTLNCDPQHLFPLDHWYAIAAVYDGKVLRSYVDGVLQGEIAVSLLPIGPGGTSIGTRYDKRDFFTGDIFSARFTPKPLPLTDLLKVPPPH